jgi:hypothetical protein
MDRAGRGRIAPSKGLPVRPWLVFVLIAIFVASLLFMLNELNATG